MIIFYLNHITRTRKLGQTIQRRWNDPYKNKKGLQDRSTFPRQINLEKSISKSRTQLKFEFVKQLGVYYPKVQNASIKAPYNSEEIQTRTFTEFENNVLRKFFNLTFVRNDFQIIIRFHHHDIQNKNIIDFLARIINLKLRQLDRSHKEEEDILVACRFHLYGS